jgi:hypothetical protein
MSNLLRRLGRSTAIALILSPAGLLLIAVTRLLFISNYNSVTAVTLVSSSGYVNTLLGTIIPLVSIFMPYIALVLLFFRKAVPGILALVAAVMITPTRLSRVTLLNLMRSDLQSVNKLAGAPAVIFLFIAVLTATLLLFTLALFGLGMFFRTVGTIASLALIPAVVFLYPLPHKNNFYSDQLRAPWLPAETITLTSGREFTGYVLSSDSDWLVVLGEDTRRITYYRVSRVVRQRVCQIGQVGVLRPLVTLTPTIAVVPSCVERTVAESRRRPAVKKAHGECAPIPPQVRPAGQLGYRTIPRCVES